MRILLIDEALDDRYAVAKHLTRELGSIELVDVATAVQMQRALDDERPSAAILELRFSWSDGFAVAKALRTRWPELPIVVYTAHGDEDAVVRTMRAGLDDYVVKGRDGSLNELVDALGRALAAAAERRERATTDLSYREFFDRLPVALYLSFPDGTLLGANPAFAELLGYPDRESLLGTNVLDLYWDPADRERYLDEVTAHGVIRGFECRLRRADGSCVWVRETSRVVSDPEDGTVVFQGTLEDITRRKELENAAGLSIQSDDDPFQ